MTTLAKPPGPVSGFRYDQCIFEARHPFAILHWDKAGSVWQEFSRKWPNLEPTQVEPGSTQFILNHRYSIFTSVEKSAVTDLRPSRSGDNPYQEITYDFLQIVTKHLDVPSFTRLGHRQVFFKKYPNHEAASESFFAMKLMNIPPPPSFGIDTSPIYPTYNLRWENEKVGASLRMKVERKHHILDSPSSPVFDRQDLEEAGIVVDIDYYTVATVSVGQLDARIWLDQTSQIIRREINNILGES